MNLAEKYKPKDWSQVVGQDDALKELALLRAAGGLGGRSYWLAADSGQEKTAIADLIAADMADPWNTRVYDDPSQLNDAELDRIWRENVQRPIGKGVAYIVNQAHGLQADQVRQLLGLTDTGRVPEWCAWCFTTTEEGQKSLLDSIRDAHAMISRCQVLSMRKSAHLDLSFAILARKIANAENLNGKPIEDYVALAKRTGCNLRMMLSEIEQGKRLT